MAETKTPQQLAKEKFKEYIKGVKITRGGHSFEITHYEEDVQGNHRAVGKVNIPAAGEEKERVENVMWNMNGNCLVRLKEQIGLFNALDLVKISDAKK